MNNRAKRCINLLFVPLILVNCIGGQKNQKAVVDDSGMTNIVVTNDYKIPVEEMIANIEFVTLVSPGNALIGEVSNLLVTDDYIIVSDIQQAKAVFVFDRVGELVTTISRAGRGPQEYINMQCVTLTPDGGRIAVYDNFGSKVLFYDLQGNFVESKTVDFYFSSMEYLDNDRIVCACYGVQKENTGIEPLENNDLLLFVDGDFKVQSGVLPCRFNREKYMFVTPHLAKFSGDVYVNPSYCDTVYVAENNGLKARYRFDLEEIGGVADFQPDMTDEKLNELRQGSVLFDGFYVDGDDFLLFSCSYPPNGTQVDYVYSKSKQRVFQLTTDLTREDYFIGMTLGQSRTCYKKQFVAVIPAYHIITSLPEALRAGIPTLKGLKEDGNPVIVFYTLKDSDVK